MRLIILDPSLDAYSGHHLSVDSRVAGQFVARGWDCLIVANKAFPDTEIAGMPVMRHFSCTAYGALERPPVTKAYDEFIHFNQTVFDDLQRLPDGFLKPDDLLLVPTVTETVLEGILHWYAGMSGLTDAVAGNGLSMCVFLMMPSGLYFDAEGAAPQIANGQQALYYSLAFRHQAHMANPIRFIGTGQQHAREFGALLDTTLPVCALVAETMLDRAAARASLKADPARPVALLYAGDCKTEKGFALVPQIAEDLCQKYPAWDFWIHFNDRMAWGTLAEAALALRDLAAHTGNLKLLDGYLPTETYGALIAAADILVLTYDRQHYRAKSSGILWEALGAGAVVLYPDNCWLERELVAWGGSGMAYADDTAESVVACFDQATQALPGLKPAASVVAETFNRANALSTLYDLILGGNTAGQRPV